MYNKPIEGRPRAPRFSPNEDLVVKSKTIGTMLAYQLSTDDISYSGLLLSWNHNVTIPFRENTLIEMEIDPESNWLNEPVRCMGKVARRFNSNDGATTKFGISIVQIDHDSLKNWEDCIDYLKQHKSLPVDKAGKVA